MPPGALFGSTDAPNSGAATLPAAPIPFRGGSGAGAGTRQASPDPASKSGRPDASAEPGGDPWHDFLAAMSRGVLTDREERELRPKLAEAILHASDSADEFLSRTNRQHAEAQIWSTMDEDDAKTLTEALLMLGKRSAPVAGLVRMVADSYLGWRAMVILGPRIWATARWYPSHGGFALG